MPLNQAIFITGVSSGIGLGLTKQFLRQGAEVFGMSRRQPDSVTEPAFHFQPVDLSKFDTIPAALRALLEPASHLSLVVLNAGVLNPLQDFRNTSLQQTQQVMDVNVWANKIILDTLASMKLSIDQVITISSGAGSMAIRGWGPYCMSKAALNMLTSLYAVEWPETHFCSLAPGIVDTSMQEYISSLPSDKRFPAIESLKAARGTPAMPPPDAAALTLIQAMQKAKQLPSGSTTDLASLTAR